MNCDHIKTHLYASNLKRFKKPLRRKKRWQWGLGKGAKDLSQGEFGIPNAYTVFSFRSFTIGALPID